MSVHLSNFVDFGNIFIRYSSKQRTSELSLTATKMISAVVFFLVKKLFLRNINLDKFRKCLLKAYTLYNLRSAADNAVSPEVIP